MYNQLAEHALIQHLCALLLLIGKQLVASQGLKGLAAAVGAPPSAVLLDR
jgi:hypothetical protein